MLIQYDRDEVDPNVALLDVGEVWASEVPSGDKISVVWRCVSATDVSTKYWK